MAEIKSPNYLQGISWTTVSLLLDFGALSRDSYSMLLIPAAADAQSRTVERLLQEEAKGNAELAYDHRRTALPVAAEGGHLAIVERLLKRRAKLI